MDGVPRTLGQASILERMGIEFTNVIEIKVDDEVIVNRMSGRRVHPNSGRNYHIDFNPPKKEGVDDLTNELIRKIIYTFFFRWIEINMIIST